MVKQEDSEGPKLVHQNEEKEKSDRLTKPDEKLNQEILAPITLAKHGQGESKSKV